MQILQLEEIGLSFVPRAHAIKGAHAAREVPSKGHGDRLVDHTLQILQRFDLYPAGNDTPGGTTSSVGASDAGIVPPKATPRSTGTHYVGKPKWLIPVVHHLSTH